MGSVRGLAAVGALVALASCSRSTTFKLPDVPEAELAFGVLYDGTGRAVEIGPVVRRQTLTAGRYVLESNDTGLSARLFFAKLDALTRAAKSACADLGSRAKERACSDLVDACASDPLSCLSVKLAGDTCGDRLTLPRSLSLLAFESDSSGKLVAVEDASPLLDALLPCGPRIERGCPNRLPGYALTEGGRYVCTAALSQLGCDATIDLTPCGITQAVGTLDANGAFSGALEGGACTIGALAAGDVALGSGDGAFAITCGARRLVASPMEVLFGEARCPERGPPIYQTAPSWSTDRGAITGLVSIRPAGWTPRILTAGAGIDVCTLRGCGRNAESCDTRCSNECDMYVSMPDCANANPTAACSTRNTHDACLERCKSACNGGDGAACEATALGRALALSGTDDVEVTVAITDLDTVREEPPTEPRGLALLGDRAEPWVAVASKGDVRLFSSKTKDTLTEATSARVRPGLELSGITTIPNRSDLLVTFGRSTAASGRVQLLDLVDADTTEPKLGARGSALQSSLPNIDDVVAGGPDGTWLFAVNLSPVVGAPAIERIEVLTTDGSDAPPPLELGGAVTAIGALPGGAALVAVTPRGGGRDRLAVVAGDGGSLREVRSVDVAGGLVVRALLADPTSCATEDRCRVYVGYEQRDASDERGRALVGLFEYDRVMPETSRVVPTFVETGSVELSFLTIDGARNMLVAVASRRDRVTQIHLVR